MPLVSVTVQGYQSYREPQTVELDEHLTLLAGRNDVGKSALLRVLRIFSAQQPGGTEHFELTLRWRVDPTRLIERTDGLAVLKQWLENRRPSLFELRYRRNMTAPVISGDMLQAVSIDLPDGPGHLEGLVGQSPHWTVGPGDLVSSQSTAGYDPFDALGRELAQKTAFIGPRSIGESVQTLTATAGLSADASNLTDVLNTLRADRGSDTFDRIEEFLRSSFPHIDRIGVRYVTGSSPLQGEPVVYYRHSPEDPVLLSDTGSGIAQMLAIATGVLTNRQGRLFLIDEPQAFLHPQAERDLLGLLEEHPEHQYVIATHSHFLLSAKPVTQARLLRTEDGATRVFDASVDELLAELGITGADLWLADRILWVEGPTEVQIFELLLDRFPGGRPPGVWVKRMPIAASMFTQPGDAAEVAFRFVSEVIDATRGVAIEMRFLFDRDEKSDDERRRLNDASQGAAEFFGRRELENYLLDPELIIEALLALRQRHGLEGDLMLEAVPEKLGELMAGTGDSRFYPRGVPEGEEPVDHVKGSEVLDTLWWDFATARYDKPRDGAALATLALERKPELLDPLAAVVTRLVEQGQNRR